jgi:hypothetical protein
MVVLASYRYNLCGHKSKRRMRWKRLPNLLATHK